MALGDSSCSDETVAWSSAAFPRQWTCKALFSRRSVLVFTVCGRLCAFSPIEPHVFRKGKNLSISRVAIAAFAQKLQEGSRRTFSLDTVIAAALRVQ